MSLTYTVIELFTGEECRYNGKPVQTAVIDYVRREKIAARCLVTRGVAGCYENGETANSNIEILSYAMPVKIEIILPTVEAERLLPGLAEMVTEGIVARRELSVTSHRVQSLLVPRQLRVRDVMTANPLCVGGDTAAADIVRIFLDAPYNAVPVVDGEGRPLGIVTQGDLIARANIPVRLGLLSRLERPRTEQLLASLPSKRADDIMTGPAVTVGADRLLGEAVDLMLKKGLKRLLVIDGDRRIRGILSRYDVFRSIAGENPDYGVFESRQVRVGNIRRVKDIVQREILTVAPGTPVGEVVRRIGESALQRAAVVDDGGRLLGLIADGDLVGLFAAHQAGLWDYLVARLPFPELARRHKELIRQTAVKTAADVMTTGIVTVDENTPIGEAVALMTERGFKRLPVVDDAGRFTGMISRDAVLRAGRG